MITPADLPDTIPLFPLSGALLLPRGRLPLHVFEPLLESSNGSLQKQADTGTIAYEAHVAQAVPVPA